MLGAPGAVDRAEVAERRIRDWRRWTGARDAAAALACAFGSTVLDADEPAADSAGSMSMGVLVELLSILAPGLGFGVALGLPRGGCRRGADFGGMINSAVASLIYLTRDDTV